jgi:hypothetical protein
VKKSVRKLADDPSRFYFPDAMIIPRTPSRFLFRIAEYKHRDLIRPMLILFLLLGSFISTFPKTTVLAASEVNPVFEMRNGSSRISSDDTFLDPPCSNDTYEPDNTYSQAQPITTDGKLQAHNNTNPTSEEDWVQFDALAGHQYEIRTQLTNDISESDTAANDTLLYLYDTNGTTQLAFNDDVGWATWYLGYYGLNNLSMVLTKREK